MKKVIWLIIIVVVVYGAWYFGSPLFIDDVVDEAFPISSIDDAKTMDELEALIPSESEIAAMPESEREELQEQIDAAAATMPDDVMEEPMPTEMESGSGPAPEPEQGQEQGEQEAQTPEVAEPKEILMGEFVDADSFHRGSGEATIYEINGGDLLLRLEDFSVTNGPDLHVLLAENSKPINRVTLGEYIDLGQLKGNKGNQNYDIPAGTNLSKYGSVVIYCKPFHVIFSTASLN